VTRLQYTAPCVTIYSTGNALALLFTKMHSLLFHLMFAARLQP